MSNCETRFAEAVEFAGFWQIGGGLINGIDDSGLDDQSTLEDSSKNFVNLGVQVGYPIRNVTQGTFGVIVTVGVSVLDTDIDWDDGDRYQIASITNEMVAAMEDQLSIAASDLHVVMQSVGACDCTLSSAALIYLKKLNIIEAAVMYNNACGNPNLPSEDKRMWLEWLNTETGRILDGDVELCQGYTGATFPVGGYAQGNWTAWSEAELVYNRRRG